MEDFFKFKKKEEVPHPTLEVLKCRNKEYVNDKPHSIKEQTPKAVIVTCIDSRIVVEDIFKLGAGDVITIRTSGNVITNEILFDLVFACSFPSVNLVMVLGHDNCAAVKRVIDTEEKDWGLLGKLRPILPAVRASADIIYGGETVSSNPGFFDLVCRTNVQQSVNTIREYRFLREKEKNGDIKIVGAYLYLDSGMVEFIC